jgi:hypothetical protein
MCVSGQVWMNTLMLNSFSDNLFMSISLGWITEILFYPVGGIRFPWFFIFLKILMSPHLKKQSSPPCFTDWIGRGRLSLMRPTKESEVLSRPFLWTCQFHSSCSLLRVNSLDFMPSLCQAKLLWVLWVCSPQGSAMKVSTLCVFLYFHRTELAMSV